MKRDDSSTGCESGVEGQGSSLRRRRVLRCAAAMAGLLLLCLLAARHFSTADRFELDASGVFAPLPEDDVRQDDAAAAPLTAYRGATLIDGTGAQALDDATVLVRGRRILAVGLDVEVPAHSTTIDVTGKWIVPGLIDAHVHYMTSGRLYTRPNAMDFTHLLPYEDEVRWIRERLAVTQRGVLCAGVTSLLSMGGPSVEYEARALGWEMDDAPTNFLAYGHIAATPNFVAKAMFPPFDGQQVIQGVTSAERATALVREGAARGADLIKTVVDTRGRRPLQWIQRRYPEVNRAVVAEAGRHGLKVTSHVHELEPARRLVEIGVDSLQHIPADEPVDADFVQLLKERDVIVVPTLALRRRTFQELPTQKLRLEPVEHLCGDPEVTASWFPDGGPAAFGHVSVLEIGKTQLAVANTRTLYEAGVRIAAGTDAGLMGLLHGASMHLELRALVDAGMTPDDAIVAATWTAARVAGKETDYGSVEAGKVADFLVLADDPRLDISNLQQIDWVVKYGRRFRQAELQPPGAGRIATPAAGS